MLRVETSNLSSARGALRSRRLYAAIGSGRRGTSSVPQPRSDTRPAVPRSMPPPPPVPQLSTNTGTTSTTTSESSAHALRHEMPPPRDSANTPQGALELPRSERTLTSGDSWNVQLELRDEEIARLYGHGLARGAVVWKKGMLKWRPLLGVADLQPILRRTRILPDDQRLQPATQARPPAPSFPDWEDTLVRMQIPAPPRLPSEVTARAAPDLEVAPTPSLAPSSSDLAPGVVASSAVASRAVAQRRGMELLLVAALSSAAAWFAHSELGPLWAVAKPPLSAPRGSRAAGAAPPSIDTPQLAASSPGSATRAPSMPTLTIADLPLLTATGGTTRVSPASTTPTTSTTSVAASRSPAADGPSRAELVSALSQVGRAAGSCGERSGPVRVIVSFANSGVAKSIRVSGENLARETRSCLIAAASRARISPFSGDPVTVSKTL